LKPLSFIIITYNRPGDMLELLKNIIQLDSAGELLEEVIIVNNNSSDDYSAVIAFVDASAPFPFRYFDAPNNLGVSKGRNYALAKGTAPIAIMLDDDAVMQNKDCLVKLLAVFEQQKAERHIAVVSFKVLYYDTLQMQANALPHKKFAEYSTKHYFETYYYAGGAHAIRRSVMDVVGKYPEDFFYGMEEYDLGYRILDAGYSIVYSDAAVMLHKESPLGRKPKKEKLLEMWYNKSKVAWRYLPKRYFYSTAIMWSFNFLKETGFDLRLFVKGWKMVVGIPAKEQRKAISNATVTHLRKVKARLWY
jgi:GT2 family glycosyltransferase